MKDSSKKYYFILLILFFFSVPLFQSLIFSAKSDGVLYIDKEVDAKFLQSDKKNLLVYFGYVGCANVCTPFLHQLDELHKSKDFEVFKEETDVLFINITPDIEPELVQMFAQSFNKDFHGIYLSRQELLRIDREFSLFFSDNLNDEQELNHTDYLYLIENNKSSKTLKSIYFTHPLSKKKLIDDMIKLKVGS